MTANDARVPAHYSASYIHWDLVARTGMGYFEGNATKYLSRWRKKGGRADLEKALHYVEKLRGIAHTLYQPRPLPMPAEMVRGHVARFAQANDLNSLEQQLIEAIACWQYVQEIDAVLRALPTAIETLDSQWRQAPGRTPPPAPVPLTEENHHAERARPVFRGVRYPRELNTFERSQLPADLHQIYSWDPGGQKWCMRRPFLQEFAREFAPEYDYVKKETPPHADRTTPHGSEEPDDEGEAGGLGHA